MYSIQRGHWSIFQKCTSFFDSSGSCDSGILMFTFFKRIGVEQFIEKLDNLRKTESFVKAEQGKTEFELPEETNLNYYDYDFTLFFKNCYDKIQVGLLPVFL
jgi:hypothetical protein